MNNNNFDKERFSRILDKAKGDRTITKYSKDSGVSISHISRLLRGLLETAPSTEIISRLAEKAYNNVSYKDFLEAAGHIETLNEPKGMHETLEIYSPFSNNNLIKELEKKSMQTILSYLQIQEYDWSIQKPTSAPFRPDMMININDNGNIFNWYIDFKMNLYSKKGVSPRHAYGSITLMDLKANDKYTIAVNHEPYYRQFIKNPPKLLKANLYVMLMDLDNGEVIKEEQISSY